MYQVQLGFDEHYDFFSDINKFLNFLREREDNTQRIDIPASDVRFCSLTEVLEKKKGTILSEQALIDNTLKKSNIVAAVGKRKSKKHLLVGESAWISMKGRIDIHGGGIGRLGSELQSKVLNKRFLDLAKRNVKLIIVNQKVRAVMSDEYAVIPAFEFFYKILEHVNNRYNGFTMVSAYVDHNISRLKIVFPEIADVLNKTYGLSGFVPGLLIETSDTGYSANRICGFWQGPRRISFVAENNQIELVHIGKANLNKIIDQLPNIFDKYQNIVKKFAALMIEEIEFPLHVLKRACKELKLPRAISKAVIEANKGLTGPVTAYDIVQELLIAPTYLEKGSPHQVVALEGKVGRAINLNFKRLQEEE